MALDNTAFGTFPDISYKEFLTLPDLQREFIIQQNRLIQTDTYNRTMWHIKGEDWEREETYVLQMRKAEYGYNVACGVRDKIEEVFGRPISPSELEFAREFYETNANVPYFDYAGWKEKLEENDWYLPLEIDAVPDGTVLLPSDPVMTVSGPGEMAAHFEPEFHRIFYPSAVASAAHRINKNIGGRFVEFGKRGAINESAHMSALKAMYVGGGFGATSNDGMVAAYPEQFKDVGTVGHRLIQFYPSEKEAFEQAVESTDNVALLIDLTDSFRGIDWALEMKEKYRDSGKIIWIRLDSGDIKEQAVYTLNKYRDMGFTDPVLDKVVLEDLKSEEQIYDFDKSFKENGLEPEKYVLYGAGGLLSSTGRARSNVSTGFKLAAVKDDDGVWEPKAKFSDTPGKESLPGRPRLGMRDGDDPSSSGRLIYQEGEAVGKITDITQPAYRGDGKILLPKGLEVARLQTERTYEQVRKLVGLQTRKSDKTKGALDTLLKNYDVRRKAA